MAISIATQTVVFLKAVILGVALSCIYDLLRVLRVLSHAKRGKTAVFDFLFCIVSGISLFFFVVFTARGEARVYIIVGALLGACLYFMTISRFVLRFSFGIANFFSKLFSPLRRAAGKAVKYMRSDMQKALGKTKSSIKIKKLFNFSQK